MSSETNLPAPLVPSNADLRDFGFLPLDVVRLRDSSLAARATGDEFRAAVLLWCASWHQVPAGSLPDDDIDLAAYTGYGRVVSEWLKVRAGALRGWIKCSDGRLYHPVLGDKAREAWSSKLEQRWKSECARIKKRNQRQESASPIPNFEEWLLSNGHTTVAPRDKPDMSPETEIECPPSVPRETPSKGQGEGQGQGKGKRDSEREGVQGEIELDPDPEPDPQPHASADAPAKSGSLPRGTRLPPDFVMPDDWVVAAMQARSNGGLPQVDLRVEIAKFSNYWQAKPGREGCKLDWRKTWINWALNAKGSHGNGTGSQPHRRDEQQHRRRSGLAAAAMALGMESG